MFPTTETLANTGNAIPLPPNGAEIGERFLPLKDYAKRVGRCAETIRRAVRAGKLPVLAVDNRYFIRLDKKPVEKEVAVA